MGECAAPFSQYWCRSSIVLILLFIKPSIQNTHYIDDNATVVVESFQPCHLYGDPDIYGIGIRLSFYIQWATIIVAFIVGVEEQVIITRWGWNVVALAVLINTLISGARGSFATLEWYIVSNMVIFLSGYFVIPFGGTMKPLLNVEHGRRPSAPFKIDAFEEDPIGIGISLLIDTAFLCSQPWLYFAVLNHGRKKGCNAKVFVPFTSVDLYNEHWVGFLKFAGISSVIVGAISGFLAVNAIGYGIRGKVVRRRAEDLEGGSTDETGTPQNSGTEETKSWNALCQRSKLLMALRQAYLRSKENLLRLLFAILGACFIAFVEKTIRINGIDLSSAPLTATSQLLPFLVGIFSAASLIWASVWKVWGWLMEISDQSKDRNYIQRGADQLHEVAVSSRG